MSHVRERLESAFAGYVSAGYGEEPLHPNQYQAIKQAYFAGVYWRDRDAHRDPVGESDVLRSLCLEPGEDQR